MTTLLCDNHHSALTHHQGMLSRTDKQTRQRLPHHWLISLFVAATLTLPGTLSTAAQATDAGYNDLIRHIIDTNPGLQAREAEAHAEVLDRKAENTLPDPEAGFEYQWGQGHLGDKHSYKLSQSFEWPGVYAARSGATKAFAEARRQNILAERRALALNIKLLLTDLTYVNRMKATAIETEARFRQLCDRLSRAYDQRQATAIDLKKAMLGLAAAGIKVNEHNARAIEIKTEIRSLTSDSTIAIPDFGEYSREPLLSAGEYQRLNLQCNPALDAANSAITAANADLKAASRSRLPGFSLGAIRATELGEHFTGFEIGISIPLWSSRQKTKAARARLDAARAGAADIAARTRNSSCAALAKINGLDRKIKPYEDFMADSQYTDLLTKAYDGGQINVLDYITELNYYLEIRAEYETLIYKRQLELVNLNRFVTLP